MNFMVSYFCQYNARKLGFRVLDLFFNSKNNVILNKIHREVDAKFVRSSLKIQSLNFAPLFVHDIKQTKPISILRDYVWWALEHQSNLLIMDGRTRNKQMFADTQSRLNDGNVSITIANDPDLIKNWKQPSI